MLQFSELALSYLPNDTAILFSRANVLGKMEKFEESEQLFKQIISIKPDNGLYYANLAVLYHRWFLLKNKKSMQLKLSAMKYYQNAIELDPNLKNARDNLLKLQKIS
jgi:tetratricopeptide (TPR) repeat protein